MAEINATQMRDALAWTTNKPEHETSSNPFVWLWEAVEGDFNEDRSTAQILVDAGISMIPLVDQVCDVRDLIADCKKLVHDHKDTGAWVSLVLTLIGLFPTLGSLVKGVLKIFFAFIRRGGASLPKKTDEAMKWVITFLRRRNVQIFLNAKKVDEVFHWLSAAVKRHREKIDIATVRNAFDNAIKVSEALVSRVRALPVIGEKAHGALEQVKMVRLMANEHLEAALKPVHEIIDDIVRRLELQTLEKQSGIVNVSNIHFRGVIPEAEAVALMRKRKMAWLSERGENFIDGASVKKYRPTIDRAAAEIDEFGKKRLPEQRFPNLTDQTIKSFYEITKHAIKGPARLYRIVSPSSRGMSDCWISKEVFERLQNLPNPKEAWRRHLGVWPDWNVNGQFVVYDVKVGETLNTWRGIAASQTKDALPGRHLEGGWEQIVFNLERGDTRADGMTYFKKKGKQIHSSDKGMSQAEVDKLTASMNEHQKRIFFENHIAIRETINHPNVSGPFETGWGYDEFEGAGAAVKIGLPALPGQVTCLQKG